ncbi:hypothetical protein [Aliidiomarina iranensis]|uniref:hypothetical protein n=1 Tax=Aliidiomarina iranensis TaxID=1434071 RepID=UPI0013001C8C|nr:hypothetical protein [Aliidiomarina iranensis]
MTNWNPDSQITSLRFNATLVGAAAVYFFVHAIYRITADIAPTSWFVTKHLVATA